MLTPENKIRFGELSGEWVKLYNKAKATRNKKIKERAEARMQEINIEQEKMLEDAKREQDGGTAAS